MKKRILSFLLVVVLCIMGTVSANAQTDPSTSVDEPPSTRVLLVLSGGLNSQGGNSYLLWGKAETSVSASLRVVASLYMLQPNGAWVFYTDVSNSRTGYSVYASKTVNLVSGSYKVFITGYADDTIRTTSKSYVI